MRFFILLLFLVLLSQRAKFFASAQEGGVFVRINEVADKGSSDVCDGEDWVELYLPENALSPVDLTGYRLHDDNGPGGPDAFTFTTTTVLQPGEYLLVCIRGPNTATSPQFGIGGDDQVRVKFIMLSFYYFCNSKLLRCDKNCTNVESTYV